VLTLEWNLSPFGLDLNLGSGARAVAEVWYCVGCIECGCTREKNCMCKSPIYGKHQGNESLKLMACVCSFVNLAHLMIHFFDLDNELLKVN
jgi:hypothetical protein